MVVNQTIYYFMLHSFLYNLAILTILDFDLNVNNY